MKRLEFDFVVCGAGISGMIAAVAAARKGLKTALINDRSVLGGNASSEIGVVIQGSSHHSLNYSVYAKETGLMDELRSNLDYAVSHCGYGVAAACDAVFFDYIYAEPNITLYLNTTVTDVVTADGKITAVHAYQMRQDEHLEFVAPIYADCTGDAVVAHKAGADTSMGAEAKAEFGEKSADEEAQTWTMGHTLYFEIEDVGHPVKFVRPAFAHDVSKMEFMKHMNDPARMRMLYVGGRFWTLEYGGQVNTIADNEHIHLELRKLVYGLWDHIKNSGQYPADNFVIKRVYSIAGSRESRRVLGDYILTETDLDNAQHFEDSVLIGGWPMDLHAPKGIYDDLPASAFIPVTMIYDIPYRCLYSRNVDNLYMAGRNISTTHIALSSTRVIGTCGAAGQAIGTAAALCLRDGALPRQVGQNSIRELQTLLLEDDQFIIGKKEHGNQELEDHFAVTASNTHAYENQFEEEIERPLTSCVGLALPLKSKKLESLSIKVKNNTDKPQTLQVRVLRGQRMEAYVPSVTAANLEFEIAPSFCGWQKLNIDEWAGEDGKLHLVLLTNEALSVFGGNWMLPGAVTSKFYTEKNDGYNHNTCPLAAETGFVGQDNLFKKFNLSFKDVCPEQDIFSAQHILNGFTRPYGHMNMWLSEGQDASFTLTADAPQYVQRLELYFDNELEDDIRRRIPKAMVKDYDVIIKTDDGEKTIEVRDNFQRRNVVPIGCYVESICVNLLTTYGNRSFAVYGVKLY